MSEIAGDAASRAPRTARAIRPTGFWALTLGSVGVVYGDIGTSPLYAFREAVSAAGGPALVTRDGCSACCR